MTDVSQPAAAAAMAGPSTAANGAVATNSPPGESIRGQVGDLNLIKQH
jgi:hypothetical protein